jgi:tetratricopeptide (TPR) repeat protein
MSLFRNPVYWLYRPYVDLGPHPSRPPHHVLGIDFAYRSLAEERDLPRLQASLNPSFRTVLIEQGQLDAYDVASPQALPPELRTERWDALCGWVEHFPDLGQKAQVRVVWLLAKMCFFGEVTRLLPDSVLNDAALSPNHASLAYVRSWSRFRMQLDDPHQPYSIAEFERIANEAPPGIAQIDAHYQLVSQSAKYAGDLAATEYWQVKHRESIERWRADSDEFHYKLLMSRFHRIGGFIPQMRRDGPETVQEMQLAEDYARAMPRPDEMHSIGADEMLYPVLESRIKEALWVGDPDQARRRAIEITELAPHDPRAWLHRGQVHVETGEIEAALRAYQHAGRYSPPGREVAYFMVGQCQEKMGDIESACDSYTASLQADPYAISSAEALETVAGKLGATSICDWARQRCEVLRASAPTIVNPPVEPYRTFPPPITGSAS